jgi:DNA-binding HxlR family transcriptional regulator
MPREQPGGRIEEILRLMANTRARSIVQSLADGPRRSCELEEIDGLARSTLYRRLGELSSLGLVKSHRLTEFPLRIEYALAPTGRVALANELLIERERLWRMAGVPPSTGSYASLVEIVGLLAPLARTSSQLQGCCVFEELTERPPSRTVTVRIEDTLVVCDAPTADARITGTPPAWDDALLFSRRGRLQIAGEAHLARAALAAIRAGLRP